MDSYYEYLEREADIERAERRADELARVCGQPYTRRTCSYCGERWSTMETIDRPCRRCGMRAAKEVRQ